MSQNRLLLIYMMDSRGWIFCGKRYLVSVFHSALWMFAQSADIVITAAVFSIHISMLSICQHVFRHYYLSSCHSAVTISTLQYGACSHSLLIRNWCLDMHFVVMNLHCKAVSVSYGLDQMTHCTKVENAERGMSGMVAHKALDWYSRSLGHRKAVREAAISKRGKAKIKVKVAHSLGATGKQRDTPGHNTVDKLAK